ncbi:hypothetical protein TSMEX_011005 [Taenia solium]|eukprot:TsM_000086100 transcript=TsM_000086100 gene=TsM_000086100
MLYSRDSYRKPKNVIQASATIFRAQSNQCGSHKAVERDRRIIMLQQNLKLPLFSSIMIVGLGRAISGIYADFDGFVTSPLIGASTRR